MTYTSHGHYIPGTPVDPERPKSVARCGGIRICKVCGEEYRQSSDAYVQNAVTAQLVVLKEAYKYVVLEKGFEPQIASILGADGYSLNIFNKTRHDDSGSKRPDSVTFDFGGEGKTFEYGQYIVWSTTVDGTGRMAWRLLKHDANSFHNHFKGLETHDEETLTKVYKALETFMDHDRATALVHGLQNAGILFRERG